MIRIFASAFFAVAAHGAAAQETGKPLGELLDVLPPPEGAPAEPASPPPAPPPEVSQGSVGTLVLPPSQADGLGAPAVPASGEVADVAQAEAEAPLDGEAEADAAWAAMQEERRRKVNEVEAPLVARLNAEVAARQEAQRRANEEARAAREASLAAREETIRRAEAEYRAALERHRRELEMQQARYQACLDGHDAACAPR